MKRISLFLSLALATNAFAQQHDKATFTEVKPGYYQNTIMRGINEFEEQQKPAPKQKIFKMDLTGVNVPTSASQFQTVWKTPVISQGNTGTCWSFSTTSFYETEINRLTKQNIDLSEVYTVYWEYVEKARRFVQQHGNSLVDEGSEANAVKRIMKQYGAVPADQYTGLPNNQKYYNHSKMVADIKTYLASVKESAAWNEDEVLATVKGILNSYMGAPPAQVTWEKKTMSPVDFAKNVCKLNMDDYVDVISLMQKPYWTQMYYNVPDNWWMDSSYYNVPLDTFMTVVKRSIRAGYSMSIGGDVSESGFVASKNVAMVPSYDIPSEYIDETARQFRFMNGTTTDDHGMHLVGWKNIDGKDWFLIKDSSAGSRNVGEQSENFGYYFFHEDYVKLKMVDFMVHKDMVKNLLPKFVAAR